MPSMPPELWWDPSRLHGAKPLDEKGELLGSPFPVLTDALSAVDERRRQRDDSSPDDNVFLVTWLPRGYVVYEYSETRLGKVDLDELSTRGLPLGGSIDKPHTYVVDARGVLGRLIQRTGTGYFFERVDRSVVGSPVPPSVYVPAYVPEPIENHGGNVAWFPRVALRPGSSIDELSAALRWIHDNLPKSYIVKAGGSLHSWSPVCSTDGVYVHPEGMRAKPPLFLSRDSDPWLGNDVDASHFARMLSGTTIRTINRTLWDFGLALPTLGGYDGQTIGGVLPTGTHGSVLRSGPLAESVRSLDLVRFDGQVVRIEPHSKAITNPDTFCAARPDWQLVQNDDEFNAVLLSMGSMGIVHSLMLEARDRFWMTEIRTATTMPDADDALRGGNIYHLMECDQRPEWVVPLDGRAFAGHPKPAYHEELLWNPYTDKIIVTSRHPVDAVREAELAQNEPDFFANPPVRNLLRALKLDAMPDEYSRPDITELGSEYLKDVLDDVLETIAKVRPKLLPFFIDSTLSGMLDEEYTQRSYHVFNIGDGANRIPAQSGTISVPLHDDMWLDAVRVIRDVTQSLANDSRKYMTGPISMRFVRRSDIMLADPKDVCKFEMIFGGDSSRVKALSRDIVSEVYHALYERFGANVRLHWGQLIPDGTLDAPGSAEVLRVRESYSRFDDWRAIRDRHDPDKRGVNEWLRNVIS